MDDEAKRKLEVAVKATVFAAVILALVTADVGTELHGTQDFRAAVVASGTQDFRAAVVASGNKDYDKGEVR